MIRFVVGPDQRIVPDLAENLPGRGLWLTARRDIVLAARDRKAFGRAARGPVTVPDDLADTLEALLASRCVELLALARRAGEIVAGYESAREWVRDGRAALLFTARDSSGSDAERLSRRVPETARVRVLNGAELGRATGRDMVVNVAVARGRLADKLKREGLRLAGFREMPKGTEPPSAGQTRE